VSTALLDCEIVCEDTSKLDRADWLELRKLGIGSSDAAAVLSLSPWRSQYNVYVEKIGLLADRPDTKRFRGGRMYEEPTLRLWAEDADVPFDSIQRHLMLRSLEYPWMLANPDGLLDEPVVEVKTAHSMDRARWEEMVPVPYIMQAHHLMVVTGRRRCIIAVAFDWTGPIEFEVQWDRDTAESLIVIERDFWRRVEERDAPDPDGSESSMAALREQYQADRGQVVDLPSSALTLIERREIALEAALGYSATADYCKSRLMAMLGEAEYGRIDGSIMVTWKADKNGKRTMRFMDRAA
jgi:putative phage-type endonuclease